MESSVNDSDSNEEGLQDRIREFNEFADATVEARRNAEKCRDYKDGKQLSEEERKALKKRRQPPVIDNKIQDKCDTLLGIEKQTRTDPKAFPRTPEHEDAADAATDALRYVADDSNFTDTTTAACDNLVVEGMCAGEVIVEKREGGPVKVRMNRIRWDRVYCDPHSLELDYSDSDYKGFFTWMSLTKAYPMWPEKKDKLDSCFSGNGVGIGDRSFDDKPRFMMTTTGKKRVQIFTTYYRENDKWMRAVWCAGGYLEGPAVSNYKDENGKPDCCLELQAVYKDRDGFAYGCAQRWIDLQDAHNKRHSKMLHLLNTKQIHAEKGAFPDLARARDELHKPDGVVEYSPGFKSEIVTNLDMAQGQFQLLQYTDAQLSMTGPNAALMGQSGDLSGRAKQLDQQSGALTTAPLFNALRSFKLRMYRHAWNRIRQYWTAAMWIRVTDDEDNVRFVGLNQPVTHGEMYAEHLKQQGMPDEQKQQLLQGAAADPRAQQPVLENGKPKVKNSVAEMDVDIIIDEAQDTITVQSEEFDKLVSLAESRVVQIPPKALIAASQLRSSTKKMILDQMSGANDPAAQQAQAQQQQFMQMMQQLEAALKNAEVRKVNAQASQAEQAAAESHIDGAVKAAEFLTPDAAAAPKTQVSVN